MRWEKKGLIFNADNFAYWAKNGAIIPNPVLLDNETIRVFITSLDNDGVGRTWFVDLDKNNLHKIKNKASAPLFEIGEPGTFDENGALACSMTELANGDFYCYYAGFELGTKIRYRILTGLTVTDKNFNIKHKYNVPVLERSESELFFRCGPFCRVENNIFKMWYVAGSNWAVIDGKSMPVYEIKYLESKDGINWPKEGTLCIKVCNENEYGFGRPYVIWHNGKYKMFYSIRVKRVGYRLGYAESVDGLEWVRKDEELNLNVSPSGWDSEMICYSAVIEINGKLIMFYNGNNFGGSGFGYAELIEE